MLLLPALAGCKQTPPDAHSGGPLDPWRRQLADDTVYPVRDGKHVDPQALRKALTEGRAAQREAVRAAVLASVERIDAADAPSADDYDVRATFEHDSPILAREVEGLQVAVTPDLAEVALRFATRNLTFAMTRELDLPGEEIGLWSVFFNVALPATTRCSATEDTLSICIDYGSLDVLVVDFMADPDVAWIPHRVQWLQRR